MPVVSHRFYFSWYFSHTDVLALALPQAPQCQTLQRLRAAPTNRLLGPGPAWGWLSRLVVTPQSPQNPIVLGRGGLGATELEQESRSSPPREPRLGRALCSQQLALAKPACGSRAQALEGAWLIHCCHEACGKRGNTLDKPLKAAPWWKKGRRKGPGCLQGWSLCLVSCFWPPISRELCTHSPAACFGFTSRFVTKVKPLFVCQRIEAAD